MTAIPKGEVSKVLPPDVVAMLVRAAETKNAAIIDAAIIRAKTFHPEFFTEEEIDK